MKNTIIIAEAGVNHNGDLIKAKKLIDIAANAKVDYVKFQTFSADQLVSKIAPKAEYQLSATNKNESQHSMLKNLELSYSMHEELIDYCNHKKVNFLSTPFDVDSIKMLERLNLDLFKIPSGEITNLPYLQCIGKLDKKIFMSSGMASLDEIRTALNILIDSVKIN